MGFFQQILRNDILLVSIVSWFIAQLIKVVLTLLTSKTLDFSRFVGSGGMPSSHSSFVVSMAVGTGIKTGFHSDLFALAFVISLIVMYDAAGVRRSVGKQAEILNKIVEDIQEHRENLIFEKRLKELIGHTPVEVLSGAVLGIIIANLML